ncbi:hypothetical protein Sliba_63790 [Streptomyces nigrescens]|uniref:Uncharacterized protein n=1 Tax=Streptomyces nigrescens TaxID=1920 RepID=A0A640TUW8_STRNI|nr:hypothetical protein Sliba_63790 [Streptomyces libani subsp. libani]GGW03641.1 hypothetical protein GCM10010500_63880 [Streptomyces libani subsp. libani]
MRLASAADAIGAATPRATAAAAVAAAVRSLLFMETPHLSLEARPVHGKEEHVAAAPGPDDPIGRTRVFREREAAGIGSSGIALSANEALGVSAGYRSGKPSQWKAIMTVPASSIGRDAMRVW